MPREAPARIAASVGPASKKPPEPGSEEPGSGGNEIRGTAGRYFLMG